MQKSFMIYTNLLNIIFVYRYKNTNINNLLSFFCAYVHSSNVSLTLRSTVPVYLNQKLCILLTVSKNYQQIYFFMEELVWIKKTANDPIVSVLVLRSTFPFMHLWDFLGDFETSGQFTLKAP